MDSDALLSTLKSLSDLDENSQMEWLVSNALKDPARSYIVDAKVQETARMLLKMLKQKYDVEQINNFVCAWFAEESDDAAFEPMWQCMLDRRCKTLPLEQSHKLWTESNPTVLVIGSLFGASNVAAMLEKLFGAKLVSALMQDADKTQEGFVTRSRFNRVMKATSPCGYLGELVMEKQQAAKDAIALHTRMKVFEPWLMYAKLDEAACLNRVIFNLKIKTSLFRQGARVISKIFRVEDAVDKLQSTSFSFIRWKSFKMRLREAAKTSDNALNKIHRQLVGEYFSQWDSRRLQLRDAAIISDRALDRIRMQLIGEYFSQWDSRRLQLRDAAHASGKALDRLQLQLVADGFMLWDSSRMRLRDGAMAASKAVDKIRQHLVGEYFSQWDSRRLRLRDAAMGSVKALDRMERQLIVEYFSQWDIRRLRLRDAAVASGRLLDRMGRQLVAAYFGHWNTERTRTLSHRRLTHVFGIRMLDRFLYGQRRAALSRVLGTMVRRQHQCQLRAAAACAALIHHDTRELVNIVVKEEETVKAAKQADREKLQAAKLANETCRAKLYQATESLKVAKLTTETCNAKTVQAAGKAKLFEGRWKENNEQLALQRKELLQLKDKYEEVSSLHTQELESKMKESATAKLFEGRWKEANEKLALHNEEIQELEDEIHELEVKVTEVSSLHTQELESKMKESGKAKLFEGRWKEANEKLVLQRKEIQELEGEIHELEVKFTEISNLHIQELESKYENSNA